MSKYDYKIIDIGIMHSYMVSEHWYTEDNYVSHLGSGDTYNEALYNALDSINIAPDPTHIAILVEEIEERESLPLNVDIDKGNAHQNCEGPWPESCETCSMHYYISINTKKA